MGEVHIAVLLSVKLIGEHQDISDMCTMSIVLD